MRSFARSNSALLTFYEVAPDQTQAGITGPERFFFKIVDKLAVTPNEGVR